MLLQILLLLSHGNARVESGFSVNESLLVENLTERSVIAQRMVYDAIRDAGGCLNVNVSRDMLIKVRSASGQYKDYLSKMKQLSDKERRDSEFKKQQRFEIRELENKKRKLQEEAALAQSEIESKLKYLKK